MTALAIKTETRLARPLKELVPLIRQDIEAGKDAERQAGLPYYQAAGEKLLEAKEQLRHGEFKGWVERNLSVSYSHAHKYMQLAEAAIKSGDQKSFANDFSSLSDFIRQGTGNKNYNKPHTVRPQAWHQPIKDVLATVDEAFLEQQQQKELEERQKRHMAEAERIKAEREERELEKALALKLIDIGYKALATKLHPDKGGSAEAFQRLDRVKRKLRNSISG